MQRPTCGSPAQPTLRHRGPRRRLTVATSLLRHLFSTSPFQVVAVIDFVQMTFAGPEVTVYTPFAFQQGDVADRDALGGLWRTPPAEPMRERVVGTKARTLSLRPSFRTGTRAQAHRSVLAGEGFTMSLCQGAMVSSSGLPHRQTLAKCCVFGAQ